MGHRIVIASMPLAGHVGPLRPIARALVQAGHDVRWCTGKRFEESVSSTGARYVPLAPEIDHLSANLEDVFPERRGLTGLKGLKFDMKRVFIDPIPKQLESLRRAADEEQIDVLVADNAFSGAAAFHELTGVPWASVGVTPLTVPSRDTPPFGLGLLPKNGLSGRLRDRLLKSVFALVMHDVEAHHRHVRKQLGMGRPSATLLAGISPLLHLQNGVTELEYPRRDLPIQVHFVGALVDGPSTPDDNLPAWWDEVVDRSVPVVHVTQGTIADADLEELVLPTVRALAGESCLVVAGTGRTDPETLGDLPSNVRAVPFISHDLLLPHTSVMVTNGGFGAVQKALCTGVPLVVAGATEDKPEVAARIEWAGVGINLRTGKPTEEQIRNAVLDVLGNAEIRQNVQKLRSAYARANSSSPTVHLINQLATTGRRVNRIDQPDRRLRRVR
ncbi:glycosyltransferase [Kribbella sp. CA-253562]|uniref:glycosyltransferase n=1 Tax=Kribbella sp. CA-253562 TaxID=3239942 RepID=UPI003D922766